MPIQLIVAIVIFIVIMVVKSKKIARGVASMDNGEHQGENFPFPKMQGQYGREQEQVEDEWEYEDMPKLAKAPFPIKGDKMAVKSVPHHPTVVTPNDEPEFEFDVKKAIIYSEIMQPKFKEY